MAGLLKQLQKSAAKKAEDVQPVILDPANDLPIVIAQKPAPKGTEAIDRRYVEAELLLGDLIRESKPAERQRLERTRTRSFEALGGLESSRCLPVID